MVIARCAPTYSRCPSSTSTTDSGVASMPAYIWFHRMYVITGYVDSPNASHIACIARMPAAT